MTTGTQRRTQAERRAAAERRLLDATAGLIAEGGSRAVTLAEAGRAAGYSRGIVTHHFGSRDALLAALARAAQQRVAPPDQPPGLGRLLARAEAYVGAITAGDPYARAFLLLWAESAGAAPELRDIFAERDELFLTALLEDLRAAQADSTVRADLDLPAAAWALIGQLRGIGLCLILQPGHPHAGSLVTEVRNMLQAGLAGPGGG